MFFFQTILHVSAPHIKKMRHFCDIGLHNCNFLLDYNDLTLHAACGLGRLDLQYTLEFVFVVVMEVMQGFILTSTLLKIEINFCWSGYFSSVVSC